MSQWPYAFHRRHGVWPRFARPREFWRGWFRRVAVLCLVGLSGGRGAAGVDLPDPAARQAMVSRALHALAASQRPDGTWDDTHGDQPGVAALAALAFLSSGEDPLAGPYAPALGRCLQAILAAARPEDGFIGDTMYSHALAVLALAAAYGEVPDERLGPVLRSGVRLLLRAQAGNARGAWRYSPRSLDADTPVSAVCLVALVAAHGAGQNLPAAAVAQAQAFLLGCHNADGGFGYTGPGDSAPPRTAACTLALALAQGSAGTEVRAGCEYLVRQGAASAQYPFYYRLFAAWALVAADPDAWPAWDRENLAQLRTAQADSGAWGGPQGTAFSTAAAVLSLTAGERRLPGLVP